MPTAEAELEEKRQTVMKETEKENPDLNVLEAKMEQEGNIQRKL